MHQRRPAIVLASSSRYRAERLAALGVVFKAISPDVDERAMPGERADALARRLAQAKALAVAQQHPEALVIGSDQVIERDGLCLGKPGDLATARAQLQAASGRNVNVWTALVLRTPDARSYDCVAQTRVRFRRLDDALIDAYLSFDEPLDCAGSFKIEAGGAALFETVVGDDPNALIGLPLVRLAHWLRVEGVRLFEPPG